MPAAEAPAQSGFEQTLRSARHTMLFREILKMAYDSFLTAKARFALTALGMVIGTASVILVVTIGLTGKQYILSLIEKIGTNSVELEYVGGGGGTPGEQVVNSDFLTRLDEKAVVQQVPGVMYSSPVLSMNSRISFGNGVTKDTLVLGVDPQYQLIRNLIVTNGRFFDDADDAEHMKVAVVTEPFARDRYGSDEDAVGQTFQIQGIPFTIIGVFRESVNDFGQSEIQEQTVLIPYFVARYFSGTERVNQIYFSMRSRSDVEEGAKEIVRLVSSRHRPNSVYKAQTLTALLTTAAEVANALTAILVLVAAVTLAVGGVGIMNIMLATVRSRIREIGIRKALGATRREIKLQFLTEAVLISVSGGIVGMVIGLAIPMSVSYFTDYSLPFSWLSVVIALTSATLTGIIFGTVPATRAAQMDPVDALKFE